MFDEGPTKLHDAVSSVLGLDELTAAQNVLRTARLSRQKQVKATLVRRDEIVAVLEGLDDERARQCVAATRGRSPALDVVEKIATASHPVGAGGNWPGFVVSSASRFRIERPCSRRPRPFEKRISP